ncbi:response regulator [Sulfitobacter sp. JBTF-M27]|uniref:Response regulator n=1 Tax=Sulfitobacter sediminilitoris TaxID=2698830 RepID=A0A6P0CJN9_9RHOB|nr:response regulator [Sulfitobacter sediminilitoris]NEK24723.1 response regulator [Sulfitobacter sediminilitoris]
MSTAALTRVVIVLGKELETSNVAEIIANNPRYVVTTLRMNEIAKSASLPDADVVLVDFNMMGDEERQIFSEVRANASDKPLIVVSEKLEPDAMRHLFKFNVDDWLSKPVEPEALLDVITNSVRAKRSDSHQVNAVISCVGGAGATTVAINMADIACKSRPKRKSGVALVDLDFSTGNCSYLLNMVSTFNLGTVASAPSRIDQEFISVIQQKHDAGFFLYSFKRPEVNTDPGSIELVLRLLDAISLEHSNVFLDIPYYETPWRSNVLSAVDTYTLVTELNLPAIKHTLDLIEHIKELRGGHLSMHVIFNKHSRKLFGARITSRRIKELLGDIPFSYLPSDGSMLGEAADRGVLPSEISTRSPFLKKLANYMETARISTGTTT